MADFFSQYFFSSCIHHNMNQSVPYKGDDYQMNKLMNETQ